MGLFLVIWTTEQDIQCGLVETVNAEKVPGERKDESLTLLDPNSSKSILIPKLEVYAPRSTMLLLIPQRDHETFSYDGW